MSKLIHNRIARRALSATLMAVFAFLVLGQIRPAEAAAGTPAIINYQARVTNASGTAITAATNMRFAVYDAAGDGAGNCVWSGWGSGTNGCGNPTASQVSVTPVAGVFSIALGDTTVSSQNAMPASLFNDDSRYLEIQMYNGATWETLSPRKHLLSAPYAFNSNLLDGLDTSAVGGASAFVPVTDGSGNLTLTGTVTVGSDLITSAATANLFNTNATTLNIGGAATTAINIGPSGATGTSVNIAGGSGATGCTVDGATGNLTCSGAVATPTSIVATGSGTITSAGLLTASNGFTVTTGTITLSGGTIAGASPLVFDGATAGTFTTTFAITDPTTPSKTITFPNATITVNAAADISGTTLASNVITSSLTTVGALTSGSIASGFGTISTANTISTSSSISTTGSGTITSAGLLTASNGFTVTTGTITLSGGTIAGASPLVFDGATAGTFTTTFAITDPTTPSKTITFPNATITVNAAADISGTTLASNVITSSLTTVGALTSGSIASGFGTISTANTISTSSSISTTGSGTITSAGLLTASNGFTVTTGTITLSGGTIAGASPLVFDGATAGTFTTTFAITDPTTPSKTITFPNATITVNAAADISGTTLASNVITSSLTTVGALTSGSIASGFGTISTANTISTSSSISTTGSGTITSAGLLTASNGFTVTTGTITLSGGTIAGASPLVFDGATAGTFTTTFAITDPTTPSKTITFPNATGTVAISASSPLSLDAAGNLTCSTCATGTVTLQSAYNGGQAITTSSSHDIAFTLTSGNFTASGAGSVNLTPTGASSFTSAGALTFTAGAASTWSTSSGTLAITGAASLNLTATNGNSTWKTTAGTLTIQSGDTSTSALTMNTLAAAATGGIAITSGNASGGNSGAVSIDAGTASGTVGTVSLGNTNATTVSIGTSAATTINIGATGSLGRTFNIGTGTGVDTIHIGDGATGADLITIGSTAAGASSFKSGAALTFTAGAASTWSTSAGALTITSAAAATWSTTAGNLTLQAGSGVISLGSTSSLAIANASTLAFTDGTNTLVSVIDQGTYGTIKLSDKGSANDPASCTAGEIYYNGTDDVFKGCTATNTWTSLSQNDNVKIVTQTATQSVTNSSVIIGSFNVTITPKSTTSSVLLNGFVDYVPGNTTVTIVTLRIYRGATSAGTLVGTTLCGTGNNYDASCDWTFVDSPTTTSAQAYSVYVQGSVTNGNITNRSNMAMEVRQGADVAELYGTDDTSIVMGDVVSVDPALDSGVRKSVGAYDGSVLGIVSTQPSLVMGLPVPQGAKSVPVALAGRVPVKVTAENGPIRAGDWLTTSSTPGVAMRATAAASVVGQAISAYSGEGVGLVMAVVHTGFYPGPSLGEVSSSLVTDSPAPQVLTALGTVPPAGGFSSILAGRLIAETDVIAPTVAANRLQLGENGLSLAAAAAADGAVRLSFAANDGTEIGYLNAAGDLALRGRLYLGANDSLQSDSYLTVDALGRVNANQGFASDRSGYAETFAANTAIAAGTVVTIDPSAPDRVMPANAGDAIVGVAAPDAGFVAGSTAASGSVAVVVSGRASVQAQGEIKAGDALVVSASGTAGKQAASGAILGYALEPHQGDEASAIAVMVAPGYRAIGAPAAAIADATASGNAATSALTAIADLNLSGFSIVNAFSIAGINGNWQIDENGLLTAVVKTDTASRTLYGVAGANVEISLSGSAKLEAGHVRVIFSAEQLDVMAASVPYKVIITPTDSSNGVFVPVKDAGGFDVTELDGGKSGATFDWLVIARRKGFENATDFGITPDQIQPVATLPSDEQPPIDNPPPSDSSTPVATVPPAPSEPPAVAPPSDGSTATPPPTTEIPNPTEPTASPDQVAATPADTTTPETPTVTTTTPEISAPITASTTTSPEQTSDTGQTTTP